MRGGYSGWMGACLAGRRLQYTLALVDGHLQQIVYTIMSDFDPTKEAINLSKHRISLARWIDIDMKITFVDSRRDYGEIR